LSLLREVELYPVVHQYLFEGLAKLISLPTMMPVGFSPLPRKYSSSYMIEQTAEACNGRLISAMLMAVVAGEEKIVEVPW